MATKKQGGDYIGRDQKISAGNGSVVIGGNVTNSTIVTGDKNVVTSGANFFLPIYQAIEERKDLTADAKADLKAEIQDVEAEVKKGEQADETFLARRLRNIRRIAPDILEVVTATLTNPTAGFSLIARKVAEKARASAD
ncbi:MAG: hypothetical protein ACUVRJ_03895 [Candidatus Villigracilaceae bacterium]